MTVGMSIDPKLLLSNFSVIMGSLGLLLGGNTILVALVRKLFGISTVSAIRVDLLLAPGGEFAFVAFGEAVNQLMRLVDLFRPWMQEDHVLIVILMIVVDFVANCLGCSIIMM